TGMFNLEKSTPTALRAEGRSIQEEIAAARFGMLSPSKQRRFEDSTLMNINTALDDPKLSIEQRRALLEEKRGVGEYFIGLGDKRNIKKGIGILDSLPSEYDAAATVQEAN